KGKRPILLRIGVPPTALGVGETDAGVPETVQRVARRVEELAVDQRRWLLGLRPCNGFRARRAFDQSSRSVRRWIDYEIPGWPILLGVGMPSPGLEDGGISQS